MAKRKNRPISNRTSAVLPSNEAELKQLRRKWQQETKNLKARIKRMEVKTGLKSNIRFDEPPTTKREFNKAIKKLQSYRGTVLAETMFNPIQTLEDIAVDIALVETTNFLELIERYDPTNKIQRLITHIKNFDEAPTWIYPVQEKAKATLINAIEIEIYNVGIRQFAERLEERVANGDFEHAVLYASKEEQINPRLPITLSSIFGRTVTRLESMSYEGDIERAESFEFPT